MEGEGRQIGVLPRTDAHTHTHTHKNLIIRPVVINPKADIF